VQLGVHPIIRPEELTGERHDLSVGGMVERFDTGDPCCELRVSLRDVVSQFVLGASRTCDQHRPGNIERLGNMLEEPAVCRCVTAADRIGLVMQVLVWLCATDPLGVEVRGVEVKDLRLMVIDPDDCMKVIVHGSLSPVGRHSNGAAIYHHTHFPRSAGGSARQQLVQQSQQLLGVDRLTRDAQTRTRSAETDCI
jgi:hypothetical protein